MIRRNFLKAALASIVALFIKPVVGFAITTPKTSDLLVAYKGGYELSSSCLSWDQKTGKFSYLNKYERFVCRYTKISETEIQVDEYWFGRDINGGTTDWITEERLSENELGYHSEFHPDYAITFNELAKMRKPDNSLPIPFSSDIDFSNFKGAITRASVDKILFVDC